MWPASVGKTFAQIDRSAYRGTRYIGQLGIEAQYEDQLLGVAGYETVE